MRIPTMHLSVACGGGLVVVTCLSPLGPSLAAVPFCDLCAQAA